MKKFILSKKAGIKILRSPVVILDENKRIFYDSGKVNKNVRYFNLPAGSYYLDSGKISQGTFVSYGLFKLPKPERKNRENPTKFKIKIGDNPNKCHIDWNKKEILFDKDLMSKPKQELMFMLYHEHGHAFYTTEKYCDLYAANCMLKKGYNPSQIGMSSINGLSSNQMDRKEYLVNKIIENG
jgi:hypothetical protein